MSFVIHGLPVSAGIAIGVAHLVSNALLEVSHLQIAPRHIEPEVVRLEKAVATVQSEFDTLKDTRTGGSAEIASFIDLASMLLNDPMLIETAITLIRERRCNAEWALVQQMEVVVKQFDEFDDPYLRERKADVVQIVERVLKELLGHPRASAQKRKDTEYPPIVVAHDLSPADTIHFKENHIGGFITDVGGATSHTAIVARSLGIPAVVGLRHIRQLAADGDKIIIDGTRGIVIVAPDPCVLEEYRLRRSELELERSKLNRLKSNRARTLDGVQIDLYANIGLPRDITNALEVQSDGVGLFRTEFLFMNRDEPPTEDEQFEAYRVVLKAMGDRPVTIRTMDVGADKPMRDSDPRKTTNPALGLRAIRYSLAEPQMFMVQLRALLRASAFGNLRILLPMLATAQEIDSSLAAIEAAKESLRAEKIKFAAHVPIGGMVEIPAAALTLGVFTKRLQFLSIGTNDLIQYTLAIDRADEDVAHLYDPLHPAVLKLIALTIKKGAEAQIPVSVCGEMAGDVRYTRLLLGMGLRHFSMHSTQVLEVKQEILRANCEELEGKVSRLVRQDEPEKILEALEKL